MFSYRIPGFSRLSYIVDRAGGLIEALCGFAEKRLDMFMVYLVSRIFPVSPARRVGDLCLLRTSRRPR